VRFAVSAVGCADLNSPFGGWWRRDGPLSASSGCGQSDRLWHWTCSDEFKWIPDRPVVNCTEAHSSGSGTQIRAFASIIIIRVEARLQPNIGFTLRLYNSPESEPILIKSGAL